MRDLVRQGYENGDYAGSFRRDDKLNHFEAGFFQALIDGIPQGCSILDWGSGPGIPYDRHLVDCGFKVTGVDISAKHIAQARRNVPLATYIHGDFSQCEFPDESFNALLCLYALFHIPRDEHAGLLAKAYRLLARGGLLLITMGVYDTGPEIDIEHDWCGSTMAWSHFDAATNLQLIRQTGFEVIISADEATGGSDEHHLWILARKP